LPIFTAEIACRPTVVFAAHSSAHALGFVNNTFIIAELRSLRMPYGEPLWPEDSDLTVRAATESESAVWERSLADDLAAGVHESREEAIQSNGFAFLVEYREAEQ